jgi:hypothetical protein
MSDSMHPADEGSLAGAFHHIVNKMLQQKNDMLPAQIISFDRATNRATVKPLIRILTTDGTTISRANNINLPVLQLSGGGYILNFPLNTGDLGWIKANDRDISLFLKNYSEAKPNTLRKNSFEDGIFIPDSMTGYSIDGADSTNLVLQKKDGSVKISIGDDTIKIIAPTKIQIDASEIELNATTKLTINTPITDYSDGSGTIKHDGVSIDKNHIHESQNGVPAPLTSVPKN